jgi:outer membrane receptor protein involved in Fe transport
MHRLVWLIFFALPALSGEILELETLEVVGETPLGEEVPITHLPANIQSISRSELDSTHSLSLSDYFANYLGGVSVSEAQNNPLQPDVQYRGFTASPLLGVPQGMTVYLNGVRFNEPFGDTLNWDLIPEGAIERIELHPGSDPLYGLNTLGGAIAVRSRTGFSFPYLQFKGYGGSFGRHNEELSWGVNDGRFGYFLHLRHFEEDGWRDFSPSHLRQAFGVLSVKEAKGELHLTLSGNDNDLTGNGAVPVQLFRQKQRAIFTHPDETSNRLLFSNLEGKLWLNDKVQFSGNAYYRFNRIATFNADDTNFAPCADDPTWMCNEDGEVLTDVFGHKIPFSLTVASATNNLSRTRQRGYGTATQLSFFHDLWGFKNRFLVGFSFDQAQLGFKFDSELARLTENRGTEGSGILEFESRVRLDGEITHFGGFFLEQLEPIEHLTLTVSGRYNASHLNLKDQFGQELSGKHTFNRFNPAFGVAYQPWEVLGFYGRYSTSSRTPTPVELTCADPEAPCKLPNAFLADPPLKQVVARSWEAGLRGGLDLPQLRTRMNWHTGFFLIKNLNDILFISAGNLTSQGFFANVGTTRRQGLEADLSGEFANPFSEKWATKLHYGFSYTFLDASFRTPFSAPSPNHPLAEDGVIMVHRGARIPLLPEHIFKFNLGVDVLPQLTLSLNGVYNGNRFLRGDEGNLSRPLPGYWVFNLRAEYRCHPYLQLFMRVDNLFDKRYQTFGMFGQAQRVLGEEFDNPRFVGPGAPRGIWGGVRLQI